MPSAPPTERVAVFGGVYSNAIALTTVLEDAARRDITRVFCLGDLGAFGPHPDRVFPLLEQYQVSTVQGNYDHSIGHRRQDCACGYTDPRDNHFAQLSYAYTFAKTSDRWKDWMRELPTFLDIEVAGLPFHLCHGSPRQTNEFLWETTTPDPFIRRLFRETRWRPGSRDERSPRAILCTHTGLHWSREVDEGVLINVGAIGRPENNGTPRISYTIVEVDGSSISPTQIELSYDYERLASEMREEGLPNEFIRTIETGWWCSCLEILPAKERRRGRF